MPAHVTDARAGESVKLVVDKGADLHVMVLGWDEARELWGHLGRALEQRED